MSKRRKRNRVIERLRRLYPGDWVYDPLGRRWHGPSGMTVTAYSQHAPRYPDDDGTFITIYRDQNGDDPFRNQPPTKVSVRW